jgi:uncharacterized membrane protein YhhN
VNTAAVVPFAALALLGLAAADDRLPRVYVIVKPLATAALFLVLAPHAADGLRLGVGIGLALATCGDALLVKKADRRFFYAGMASFALAHVAYAATLLVHAGSGATSGGVTGLALTGALTAALLTRLVPRLPSPLRAPVIAYATVLTATVAAASAWLTTEVPLTTRLCLLAGALLLYAGDAFYAFNLFISRLRFGQSVGLVLYWSGQLTLVLGVRLASAFLTIRI